MLYAKVPKEEIEWCFVETRMLRFQYCVVAALGPE